MIARSQLSLFAVLTAMAMVVLDAGMVNVALPALSEAIGRPLSQTIWVVSSYQIALLIGLLPASQLAERYGHRRTFCVGTAVYLTGSVLCAGSGDLVYLIAARTIQGLGGAVILALGISILRLALGDEKLTSAISWNAIVVALSAAASPSIAAAILAVAPWPWLFLSKVPLGLLVLAATVLLPRDNTTRESLDLLAIVLHGGVALTSMLGLTRILDEPSLAVALIAAAILASVWMVYRLREDAAPLWPLDLFSRIGFRNSAIASVFCFVAQTVGLIGLPIVLQTGAGMTILDTAFVMTCWPISIGLTARVAGHLANRFDHAVPCALGAALLSASLFILWLAPVSGMPMFAAVAVLGGLGFGLFQVPNNRSLFLSAPLSRGAAAGGMQGTARLAGQTIGAVLIGVFLARFQSAEAAKLSNGVGALCAAIAAFVSLSNPPRFVERLHA